mmetsp:Transcript_29738/g.68207  ORF Transcript_29738/g.68207 Transcript_29738/m.68207 type:complete len:261 (-) Transcript_29738:59-841(-)
MEEGEGGEGGGLPGNVVEVWLDSVAPDAMQAILEFHYLGCAVVHGLGGLLDVAQAMAVVGIKAEMKGVVQKMLHAAVNLETCMYILNNVPVNFPQAFSYAWRWFVYHFEECAKTDEFLFMEENKMEELMKQEKINCDSEFSLLQHLLRWMRYKNPANVHEEGASIRGEGQLANVRWGAIGQLVLGKDVYRNRSVEDIWDLAEPYVSEALMVLARGVDKLPEMVEEHARGGRTQSRMLLSTRHYFSRSRVEPPKRVSVGGA